MSGLRAVAHPMLASIFVVQGLDTLQHPERVARAAATVVDPIAQRVRPVPADAEQAVRLNGALQVVAGTTLGLGILPRLSALVLAGTLVPTTMAGHRYWEIEDPELRAQQRIHFLKNVTMLGGLLIAAADTDGSPSLAWRRKKASRAAGRHLGDLQEVLSSSVHGASDRIAAATTAAVGQLSVLTDLVSETAGVAGGYLDELKQAFAESARTAGDQLPGTAHGVADSVREATRTAAGQAAAYAHTAADQLSGAAHQLGAVGEAAHSAAAQTANVTRAVADHVTGARDVARSAPAARSVPVY
jgi:putative oxidoreductase